MMSKDELLELNEKLIAENKKLKKVIRWWHKVFQRDGGNAWCAVRDQPGASKWIRSVQKIFYPSK